MAISAIPTFDAAAQRKTDATRRSEYQGFLFSPAVPADEFAELLKRGIGTTLTSRHDGA